MVKYNPREGELKVDDTTEEEIWKLKKTQMVKHGEKDLISRQMKLKHKELLMQEQQSTK